MEYNIIKIMDLKDPIDEEFRNYIKKNGVITGSYKFGGFVKGESDIDIILPISKLQEAAFEDLIHNNKGYCLPHEYSQEDFKCIYVKTKKGILLNLLIPNSYEYQKIMVKTTKLMVLMKNYFEKKGRKEPFKNKAVRLKVFEYCKLICKEII